MLLEPKPLDGAGGLADDSGVRDGVPSGGRANTALLNRPPDPGLGVEPDLAAGKNSEGEAPDDGAGLLLVGAAEKEDETGLWPLAAPFAAEDC